MHSSLNIKLGISLSFAKKRWVEPEAWIEIVRDKLDLRYVEFDSDFLDPFYISEPTRSEIASEICTLAKENSIIIYSYFTGTMTHCVNLMSHPDERIRKDGLKWCEEAIKLSAILGAKGIGGHFDTISYRDLKNPERHKLLIDNLISSFQYLSKKAKKEKQEFILWEQMYNPNEVPYTISQAKELLEKVNDGTDVPVFLVLDLGHSCCQNYPHSPEDRDPYEWLRSLAHISPVIHIHQTNETESCHWPFTKEYNKIGIIQGEKVIEAIKDSGRNEVLLVLEIFFPLAKNEEQILEEMKISVDYWKALI